MAFAFWANIAWPKHDKWWLWVSKLIGSHPIQIGINRTSHQQQLMENVLQEVWWLKDCTWLYNHKFAHICSINWCRILPINSICVLLDASVSASASSKNMPCHGPMLRCASFPNVSAKVESPSPGESRDVQMMWLLDWSLYPSYSEWYHKVATVTFKRSNASTWSTCLNGTWFASFCLCFIEISHPTIDGQGTCLGSVSTIPSWVAQISGAQQAGVLHIFFPIAFDTRPPTKRPHIL